MAALKIAEATRPQLRVFRKASKVTVPLWSSASLLEGPGG